MQRVWQYGAVTNLSWAVRSTTSRLICGSHKQALHMTTLNWFTLSCMTQVWMSAYHKQYGSGHFCQQLKKKKKIIYMLLFKDLSSLKHVTPCNLTTVFKEDRTTRHNELKKDRKSRRQFTIQSARSSQKPHVDPVRTKAINYFLNYSQENSNFPMSIYFLPAVDKSHLFKCFLAPWK